MEFNQPKGIYQQISDQVRSRIVAGEWKSGERIPSIREMAVSMGVNPNTITRSYQSLLDAGIIENQRGIGYFVAVAAQERIAAEMRSYFIGEEFPRIFAMMGQLGIGLAEFVELYEKYDKEQRDEKK